MYYYVLEATNRHYSGIYSKKPREKKKNDRRRGRTCNLLIRSQAPYHWASRPNCYQPRFLFNTTIHHPVFSTTTGFPDTHTGNSVPSGPVYTPSKPVPVRSVGQGDVLAWPCWILEEFRAAREGKEPE